MKKTIKSVISSCLLLFGASLFIKAGCSKSSDDVATTPALPNADQYITWNVNNSNGSLQSPNDSIFYQLNSGTTVFLGQTPYNATSQGGVYAAFNGTTTGSFNFSQLNIYANNHYYVPTATPVQVNVTTYGTLGQYVIGSYSGLVKDSVYGQTGTSNTYSIQGNFRIKRTQ